MEQPLAADNYCPVALVRVVFQETGRDDVVPGNIAGELMDFVVPRFCLHCEEHLAVNQYFLCNNCLLRETRLDTLQLIDCLYERFGFELVTWMFSVVKFEEWSAFRTMVHFLKYKGLFKAGEYLGKILGNELVARMDTSEIDYIIPVPLHRLKLIERGYNQSLLIAKGVSLVTGIPINQKAIKRARYTAAQVETETKHERHSNIKGAFKVIDSGKIEGKNILIVDDVITTGSTIREVATELKNSGANELYAASILVA
ncbi:MAG: ComF family protein [Ignavibacteriaceae bacterium]|nr:ComF family protein [Ignavibacteriaceae bacterium]